MTIKKYSIFNSCVAYYDFSKNALDVIGSNNGTVNGATLTTNHLNQTNSAFDFDGTDDYISIADSSVFDFSANDEFSVAGWYYFDSLTDINKYPSLFCKRTGNTAHGFDLIINRYDGTITSLGCLNIPAFMTGMTGGWTQNADALVTGQWYNIVLTASKTRIELWINDVSKYVETGTFDYVDNSNNLEIGRRTSDIYAGYHDGKICNFMIFNKALSSDEVKQLYDLTKSKVVYPIVKGWRD